MMNLYVHYFNRSTHMTIEVTKLPWDYFDYQLQVDFTAYRSWFKTEYNISIFKPVFPIVGHIIKFNTKRKDITDEILIAFKLRFL